MGLLDLLQSDDPAVKQGILQFGLGLLSSKGNFGNALGNAGQQGLAGALQYRQNQAQQKRGLMQDQLTQGQIDNMKRQQELQALPGQFYQPGGQPLAGPQPEGVDAPLTGAPSMDMGGYLTALQGKDPMAALQLQQAIAKPLSKFSSKQEYDQNGRAYVTDEQGNVKYLQGPNGPIAQRDKPENVNGVWVNPYTTQPQGIAPQDPNKPFGYGVDGKLSANQLYQDYTHKNAKAGAAQTSIKIDNKLGEGLAKEVGPMVKESYDAARGAQQAIATADSIVRAVDSNKVFAGPGASLKLYGAQLGQVLGVGGKDAPEQIANTRAVIQGLAQSTLASRASLKGQGAVSDFEGKLIERAASGEIDNMTAQEIKQLAVVNKRLANQQLSNHGQFIKKLQGNDTTSGIANMFELPAQESGVVDFGSMK